MSEKDSETYRLANLKINLSPFSHRMHIVVEVTPKGLISSSSYVTYSIRFLNSTPLPYQCQRPGRTTAKMTILCGCLALRRGSA